MNFLIIHLIKSWIFLIVSITGVSVSLKYHLENLSVFSNKVLNFYLINIFFKCKIHNFYLISRFSFRLSCNVSQGTDVKISIPSFLLLNSQFDSSFLNLFCYSFLFSFFFQPSFLLFNEFLVLKSLTSSFNSFKIHHCFFLKAIHLSFLDLIVIPWLKQRRLIVVFT